SSDGRNPVTAISAMPIHTCGRSELNRALDVVEADTCALESIVLDTVISNPPRSRAAEQTLRTNHQDQNQNQQRSQILIRATDLVGGQHRNNADQRSADQGAEIAANATHHGRNEAVQDVAHAGVWADGDDGS